MAAEDIILDSLVTSLAQCRARLLRYDAYYEGEQAIRFLAPALQEEFGERITALVLNWGRIVADAYENRLDVEGFRFAGNSSGDKDLWALWQANDLDEQSQQAHLDSVALSRAYVLVGSADSLDDPPVVTVESPLQVFAKRDPRTRRVTAAVKRWDEGDEGTSQERHAMLYLPNSTRHLIHGKDGWVVTGRVDAHELGRVPVVPLVNRPRILRPDGVSEFHDVMPLADAANKMATDMMVSGEYHSMPRRWASGLTEKDFKDEQGNDLSPWSRDAGTLWATSNDKATFGQFTESDLAVFHNTIKFLAQVTSQIAALPPHYMGFNSDNPTSADAIRSSETQLVKRVERKQTYLGGAWEDVMRLVLRFQSGAWSEEAGSLETVWRDPSTPTVAQKADAAVKLATPLNGGRAIVPIEMTREELGYTPEQIRRMAEMDREAERDDVLERIARPVVQPEPVVPAGGAES